MKSTLNNLMAGLTGFLAGTADDTPRLRDVEHRPVEEMVAVGEFNRQEKDDIATRVPLVISETLEPVAMNCDVPEPAAQNVPPQQAQAAEAPLVETNATVPTANDPWLREQIESVVQRIEACGNSLKKIEDSIETSPNNRCVLEEQYKTIQDLTARLRQAEECQISDAIMGPVVADLIQIFDTVWKARRDWAKERPGNVDEWIANCLGALEGEILAMLNRHETVMIQDTTTTLNPSKQRVVGTQAPRQIRDGEVVSVVRPGFVRNGRVERPEEVVVARTTQRGGVQ